VCRNILMPSWATFPSCSTARCGPVGYLAASGCTSAIAIARGKNMTYIVLGCGLALVEVWAMVSRRGGTFYALPQGLRLLMPVLIALGSLRRPRTERIPIVLFALGLGLAINRDLTGNTVAAHVAVITCGMSGAWFGYRSPTSSPLDRHRLLQTILFVVVAFLGLFCATYLIQGA